MAFDHKELTKEETEVYDRQIRCWGIEAQNKLRNSDVLVVGMSLLGCEFVKNMALAGVRSLTMMDNKTVTQDDVGHNFMYNVKEGGALVGQNRAHIVKPRVASLNPNVALSTISADLANHLAKFGEGWLENFALVVLVDQDYDLIVAIDELCRRLGVRFICGSVFGWIGYTFFDFNGHKFLTKVANPNAVPVMHLDGDGKTDPHANTITLEEEVFEAQVHNYPSLVDAFNVDWKQKKLLRKSKRLVPPSYFLIKTILTLQKEKKLESNGDSNSFEKIWRQNVEDGNQCVEEQTVQPEKFDHLENPQLPSSCAVVGGMIGQEAIKALSGTKNPLRNIFIYSALDTSGVMCDFPPKV